jgi:glutamyl-tRNA synthetase
MNDLLIEVRRAVLENAVKYEGKPEVKSVMGVLLGTREDLRPRASEIKNLVAKTVAEVSGMTLEAQVAELRKIAPELLEQQEVESTDDKAPLELPNVDNWKKVVMRLAPFPSGPLHIGNARMVVLNDYFVKKYKGELILVFDDTIGSVEKVVEPDAFDLIPEGLDYLGVEYHTSAIAMPAFGEPSTRRRRRRVPAGSFQLRRILLAGRRCLTGLTPKELRQCV